MFKLMNVVSRGEAIGIVGECIESVLGYHGVTYVPIRGLDSIQYALAWRAGGSSEQIQLLRNVARDVASESNLSHGEAHANSKR